MRSLIAAMLAVTACASAPGMRPPSPASSSPLSVPRGTLASAQLRQPLSAGTSRAGDRFTLELLDPLVDGEGRVRVAQGAVLEGQVRRTGATSRDDLQVLGVRTDGGLAPLPTEVASAPFDRPGGWSAATAAGLAGAGVGAGAGLIADSSSGAVVAGSALVGAAVGIVVGWWLGRADPELTSGSVVTLRLVEDVRPVPAMVPGEGPPPD